MLQISRRECYMLELKSEELDKIVSKIKASLENWEIPEGYAVNVYKDRVACCGFITLGIAVEIEGPSRRTIEDLDVKLSAKIIEICEQEGIHEHEFTSLRIIKPEKGS